MSENKKDTCRLCHNALQCLVWAGEGEKSICSNWEYFNKHYVNGEKRKILEEEMKNL